MARIAGMSNEAWAPPPSWEAQEEVAPITSRSPSFVRLRSGASSEETGSYPSRPSADDSVEWIVAESRRHDTSAPPPVVVVEDMPATNRRAKDRFAELDVRLGVLALQLRGRVVTSLDRAQSRRFEELAEGVNELGAALRSLAAKEPGTHDLVQHTYEWAANVIQRLASPEVFQLEGELSVAEYSSLFVMKIIEPILRTAEELCAEAATSLSSLREQIYWLNWTARATGE